MWENIKDRYAVPGSFFAVIDPLGEWVDSAQSWQAAVWCAAMNAGYSERANDPNIMDQIDYSIVHSDHLAAMVNAGLIF